jgi:hypothetical protein
MPGVNMSTDALGVAADLAGLATTTQARVQSVVSTYGFLLQAAVKRHATGRPGPNIITGHYNASIGVQISSTGGTAFAAVGTNAAQGRRLELGFHGTDSLGRRYNQPAFPHFGPALDEIEGPFEAALAAVGVGTLAKRQNTFVSGLVRRASGLL